MTETMSEAPARHTTWQLAGLADCGSPDHHDGIGFDPTPVRNWTRATDLADRLRARNYDEDHAELSEMVGAIARKMEDEEGRGSPGARFLRHVETAVLEAVEEYGDGEPIDWTTIDPQREFEGRVHEIADGAPDVYTAERWAEFTDLAAWQEDITEVGAIDGDDITTAVAGVALYMIAERLAWALLEELAEAAGEDEGGEGYDPRYGDDDDRFAHWHFTEAELDYLESIGG